MACASTMSSISRRMAARCGLRLLPAAAPRETDALIACRAAESAAGIDGDAFYSEFAATVRQRKRELLRLLIDLKASGARICGYGAAAKGTTLLNYCGIGTDMIDFIVDRSVQKQGRFVPGTGDSRSWHPR